MKVSPEQIQSMIFKVCDVDYDVEDFDFDSQLFGDDSPLGFDSIDAMEIVTALKNEYGITMQGPDQYFVTMKSINTLTDYVNENIG
jgi:acyl carrier protein